ncbi:T9SS type A sorting domain-containing protein [Polaribacter sp. Z014]|uniref:T9SS type A sorting domain-containing protein n=1 Tax=Polaribacter sp. Z014 TaxID=2927126 RepID=UPI0020217AE1|nr:T9SS type A sorting domain-containing protein [Polaribacter sp. Z014]MCL7764533.1 T9SS type A sorting domain-containing protein [Polaribacter sp. Z014]
MNINYFSKKIIISLVTVFLCALNVAAQNSGTPFFEKIRTERIASDQSVTWVNFATGTSGYCEEFWCHPTDTNVMFSGPDMHAAFGTWDNGVTWQTLKDSDGTGVDMRRVIDIKFSLQNPDFGIAFANNQTGSNTSGKIYETNDRGRTWNLNSTMGKSHSKLAIHPTNDNIWFLGAGDFWNAKENSRSLAKSNGEKTSRSVYGYVWKTTDRGVSWKKVAKGLSNDLDVGRIIFNPGSPENMIMATNYGIYTSADTGETWTANATGLPNNLPRDLTSHYDASTGDFTLYLVEQSVYTENGNNSIDTSGGVYKSINNGLMWTNITGDLGIDFQVVKDWTSRDKYKRSVSHWLGIPKNNLDSKAYASNIIPVFSMIVVNPLNKNEIYIAQKTKHGYGFGPGDLWKTTNGGATWFPCARQGKYWVAKEDQTYWNNKTGLSTTADNINFAHLQNYMNDQRSISGTRMLAINANGDVFTGIDQQTLRSNNNGTSWTQIDDEEVAPDVWKGRGNTALPGRFMLHETGVTGRRLLCSGEHGLFQTTGTDIANWTNTGAVNIAQIEGQHFDFGGYKSAHSVASVAVHPNNPNTIFALMDRQTHRGTLRKSTDAGQTWTNIATIFEGTSNVSSTVAPQHSLMIDPVNPSNMYFTAIYKQIAGVGGGTSPALTKGKYGVNRSNDGGLTWNVSNAGLPAGASVNRIAMHPDNSETIFAALSQWKNSDPGGLYKSSDGAVNWKKVIIPSVIKSVNNIFIDRNTKHMFISTGSRSGAMNSGGVWRSIDNGVNWELIFEAPYVWQTETSPVNSNIIIISVASQVPNMAVNFKNPGAYISVDAGTTWTKINKGLAHSDRITDIKPDPYNENIIWSAGWGSGWYKAVIDVNTLAVNDIRENSKTIKLFPNPTTQGILNVHGFRAEEDVNYTIVDALGKTHTTGSLNQNKVNVSVLKKGMYIISLSNKVKNVSYKFIKN